METKENLKKILKEIKNESELEMDSIIKHISNLIIDLSSITLISQICKDENILKELICCLGLIKDEDLFKKIIDLFIILGKHSFNVDQVKEYMKLFVDNSLSRSKRMHLILNALLEIWNKDGPRFYFTFDGINSGLSIPMIENFPTSSYTCKFIIFLPD